MTIIPQVEDENAALKIALEQSMAKVYCLLLIIQNAKFVTLSQIELNTIKNVLRNLGRNPHL